MNCIDLCLAIVRREGPLIPPSVQVPAPVEKERRGPRLPLGPKQKPPADHPWREYRRPRVSEVTDEQIAIGRASERQLIMGAEIQAASLRERKRLILLRGGPV